MLPKLTVPRIGVDAGLPVVSEVLSGAFPTVFPIPVLTETGGVDFREAPHGTAGVRRALSNSLISRESRCLLPRVKQVNHCYRC